MTPAYTQESCDLEPQVGEKFYLLYRPAVLLRIRPGQSYRATEVHGWVRTCITEDFCIAEGGREVTHDEAIDFIEEQEEAC